MTDDQLRAAAILLRHDKQRIAEEPLYKYKNNNYLGHRYDQLTTRYRVMKAGNKVGKTARLGRDLVAMCKGKCEEFGINFPHKPPLKIWYCGRDRNVLTDEPLSSIKSFLKGEGIDYRAIYTGQMINMLYIWDDKGNQSEIRFKPYNGEIGIFESANVHAVFMDEEPPRAVFSAIKPKVAIMPGYVYIAMTPDKGMTWTHDLFNGADPDHGTLFKNGSLSYVEGSVFDNMLNFKIAEGRKWVRYPDEFIDRVSDYKYKVVDGITYVDAPDTFADYVSDYEYGSDEYLFRILGQFVSFTGKVYPFDRRKNICSLSEVPAMSDLKFFGKFDYGYSDEACYGLVGVDASDTKYNFGGFYLSYLDAREQAREIKKFNDYWGVVPEMIVADDQICNHLVQRDAIKSHIVSIKDYFLDELGANYTVWRTERIDKLDPHIKRDAFVRDLKVGKYKFIDHNGFCAPFIQEVERLEFKGGTREQVKGKDHFDAATRMFYGANISYNNWQTSEELAARKEVHWRYRGAESPIY
jgi:phage terminase large subunit-like protein